MKREYTFDVEKVTKDCILWIKNWFEKNGPGCNAVIGISGGKDSTIITKLCVEALGADRVIGVMMPNGVQKDISDSIKVCKLLGIKNYTINIEGAVNSTLNQMKECGIEITEQARTNLPARIRMSTLYAVSQSNNGRVLNTCNYSENYVSWETKFGDGAGDLSPLGYLTVREVLAIGDYLGLPSDLVHKTPIDGLNTNADGSYVTDEQGLGFSYDELDDYLLDDVKPSPEKLERIEKLHERGIAKNRMLIFLPNR